MKTEIINIAIVEDREDMRNGLLFILSNSTQFTCMAYSSAEEVLTAFRQQPPDIVLMDIDLPGMNGISCTAAIKQLYPQVRIIICTIFEDTEKIFDALKAGADGYILKNVAVSTLHTAINELLAGGAPMSTVIANKVVRSFHEPLPNATDESLLTKREQETLNLLSRGYDNQEIAEQLYVSINTVRTHIRHIYEKLQVRNRLEMMNKIGKTRA